jgi:transcriptional regulator with XRE-family HTH domain
MLTSMSPSILVRSARKSAGLTQAELAERAGVTQSVIARLERGGGNPTFLTLERVLHAAGHRLELSAVHQGLRTVDETLIEQQLALSPAERIRALRSQTAFMQRLVDAGARARDQRT